MYIGFTLLYFKMAVIPLVPETKMVDVSKLISLGQESHLICVHNYVCTFDFVPHIWRQPHDKDCLYILLSSTNFLSHILTSRDSTIPSFWLPETAWQCQLVRHNSIRVTYERIHSATFFFLVLSFWLDLFQPWTQPQKFHQTPKETNNQHGRRHVPPRIHCYISVYWYLAWNT